MIIVKGGVTAARGFLANGVKAGMKVSGKMDLALLYSEAPAVAAGSFTTNRCSAAPVNLSRRHLRRRSHRAVIVNSGNANCANGSAGERDALAMARAVADPMGLEASEVLVASTGIIGQKLPVEKIERAAPALVAGLSGKNGGLFARAIMTTDTVSKECAVKIRIGGRTVSIGGCCKGVGMIYPQMVTERHATMLAFIATDASISKRMLEASLDEAIKDSFNMVSVDGDQSTNDTCAVLANGLAGNPIIASRGAPYREFTAALTFMASELSKKIAMDGEGATKLVRIDVNGARTADDARRVARKVSTSNLLKCAIFGMDPNWGRIVAAAGSSGVEFDIGRTDVYLGPVKALSNGAIASGFSKDRARKFLKGREVNIKVDLKSGKARATAWTCDFSKEYVAINSEYST
jgi:glutamate N-acetyltransferase/amino-acid N-acetyltransferase